MFQKRLPAWSYLLIAIALLGFGSQLLTNTQTFFSTILMILGTMVLIYGAIYFLFLRKRNTNELKKYKKAVKQSKKRRISQSSTTRPTKQGKIKTYKHRNHKDAPYLRVIDGKKSKRKDRATF
ncbi:hypothetical protein Pryu01_00507 [Paraliobacillus ryukyuensis]|uniref:Uncharacterized protein n=1 Tax=Paraliobacillus ryukyuensis TaxID=200904 RepID=A0A366EI73_9BACI|nr:SA1362 family protein [Paraliobacillus ryukyuensis]RBP01420.1 hypothetical protein DES48_101157 [Paraliobacillus ryukyuensis]